MTRLWSWLRGLFHAPAPTVSAAQIDRRIRERQYDIDALARIVAPYEERAAVEREMNRRRRKGPPYAPRNR